MSKWLVIFMCSFVLCLKGQLPDIDVKIITESEGLKTTDIISMSKDSLGWLWLLTPNAVIRYNGSKTTTYPINQIAYQIFIDHKHRKWVVAKNEVLMFGGDRSGFRSIQSGFKRNICLTDIDDQLILTDNDGFYYFHEEDRTFKRKKGYEFQKNLPFQENFDLSGRAVFLHTQDSVYLIKPLEGISKAMFFKETSELVAVSDKEVLVSNYDSRTFYLNLESQVSKEYTSEGLFTQANDSRFLRIFGGIKYHDSKIILSTNNGLAEFDASNQKMKKLLFYHKGELLRNTQFIRTFYRDGQGRIYLAYLDGLVHFDPKAQYVKYLRNYSDGQQTFPDLNIRSFAEDDKGLLWMATTNGLTNMDMKTGRLTTFTDRKSGLPMAHHSIRYLLWHQNRLWVGTGGKGVYYYDDKRNGFFRPQFTKNEVGKAAEQEMNEDFIWKILKLENGNLLVVGGDHLYEVNATDLQAKIIMFPKNGVSRSAISDSYGNIWWGGTNGLVCADGNYKKLFEVRDSLKDHRVAAMLEISRGRVLVGSTGLYEAAVKEGKLQYFKKIAAFSDERFIFCMEMDNSGKVWLGTDDGMYSYDPVTREVNKFDSKDNFQNHAFNSNGLFKSSNGWMFAGGIAGMNYFDPEKMRTARTIPQPMVTLFTTRNEDTIYNFQTSPFEISYGNRSIRIEMGVDAFVHQNELLYRYKLEGEDREWVYVEHNNVVRLSALYPGKYGFLASASFDGVQWRDADQSVDFIIQKPWWQQWWFLTCLLLSGGIVIRSVRRNRQIRERDAEFQKAIEYFANSGGEHSTVNDILWDITRNCISRLGFEECVIYLMEEDGKTLVQKAAYGQKSPRNFEIINPIKIPVGEAIVGTVAATGIAEVIDDTSKDPRYMVDDMRRYSEITVPIIHNGEVIGIIDSEHRKKHFFNQKHLQTLKNIAAVCSAKISRGMAIEQMKNAEADLSELNKKMLEAKFLNLRLQMNPHFLFNSLNSIQHLIVTEQTNEAYKYLSVFSSFLRSVLQYADKNFITLETELSIIRMYIQLESLGFDHTFDYKINVDEKLEIEDILIPPLIIQPFIENAIWHGLLHKTGAKVFSIDFINDNDQRLICVIEDNGVGRTSAGEIKDKKLTSHLHSSKSTALTHERLQLLSQKTGKQASMSIDDKWDGTQASGTIVKLIIPFYNSNEL